MLKLSIVMSEEWNKETEEFEYDTVELELEHSLVAISKWESIHEKPFLGKDEKTSEEIVSYIKCMIISPDYPLDVVDRFSEENIEEINKYIEAKMTATWFKETKPSGSAREQITSEYIYYWMVSYQIPWEAQHWHIARLFTLINIFNVKNTTPTKKSVREMAAERERLNAERKAKYGTTG